MLVPTRLYSLTASQVLRLLKNDTITVEQYALSILGRIEERDSIVKAWTYLDPQLVLSQARALDQIPPGQRGPLHGVAVAVKDVMNTKDMPTQFGSPLYEGNQPGFDSSAVAILRYAGALILGKTVTTEFTATNMGPNTTNPHDPNRTPGGSSAGSAAAVADLQVPLGLGTQTAGSLIRPASFTGIFAMKPTFNAISTEGQKTYSVNVDTFGFFARSMEDLQLVADIFALKDDELPSSVILKDARVALIKTPMWDKAGPGTDAAMEKAATILKKHGVKVEEVSFPPEYSDGKALKRMLEIIANSDAQAAFLREYRMDKTKLDPIIRGFVENSANYTRKERVQALDRYASMRPIFDEIAADFSAIITPSVPDEAPLGLDDMGSPAFNFIWTGLHMPVIHIPAFIGAHGMPLGISVVAGRFFDQHLLAISKALSEPLMAEGGWKIS
ncbi:amidase [Capronia epimyces CBS 606.96]|uniref:Amidase n=1 Tax=Capronia epimyces CBS 606.96 TaxID=1182542 RepID=W9Y361_9EURO|nr:amidase [Capronia epimyces CBS 606.96]EXJ87257.1 amidase [Capronia epimyces CBS 606.96]